MGNVATVPLLEPSSGSSSCSGSRSRSSSDAASVAEAGATTKAAAAPTTPETRSTRTAGCLAFCLGPSALAPPPLPSLLILSARDEEQDDDDEDEEAAEPLSCSGSSPSSMPQRLASFLRRGSSGSLHAPEGKAAVITAGAIAPAPPRPDYTAAELRLPHDKCTPASDLLGKDVWVVTTASLPWLTGTSCNATLRAAHLALTNLACHEGPPDAAPQTTLVLPWLEKAADRVALYGAAWADATPERQEAYIRAWLRDDAGLCAPPGAADSGDSVWLRIRWYPARYHAALRSVFAMGDLCDRLEIRDPARAVCVLEEPEHVNFYRAPGLVGWRSKFPHVVGVVHTNYKAYAAQHAGGVVTAPLVGAMSAFMVRAYCDQVIKLSGVLQEYAAEKEVVCNVHGIRAAFLRVPPPTGDGVYFLGTMLWAKGLDRLLELQLYFRKKTGQYFPMSVYGSGPQLQEIQDAFLGRNSSDRVKGSENSSESQSKYYPYSVWSSFRRPLPVSFKGRQDHATLSSDYKIFVNPSVTEVLCTSTAEAVAMGKFVIVPEHPSNSFFATFPNVLMYRSNDEFVQLLQYARSHAPVPLSDELRHVLSWEAATERFVRAAAVSERDAARRVRVGGKYDETIARWHYKLGRGSTGDVLRKVMGAGPVAEQHKYEAQSISVPPMTTSVG